MVGRLLSVLFVVGWSVLQVLQRILEVPGHIDDATTWLRWLRVIANLPISNPAIVIIGFIIFGPLLWTSGWWYPRIRSRFKRRENRRDAVVDKYTAQEREIQRFKESYSLIKRQADSRHPPSGWLSRVLNPSSDFDFAYARLTDRLNELAIPYPSPDTSETQWYVFLVRLGRLAEDGKLEEARTLWPTLKAANERGRFQTLSSKINECKCLAMQLDLSDFMTRQFVNPTGHKERQARLSAELEHLRPELNSIGISLPGFDVNSQSEIPNLIEYLTKLGVHAQHGDIQAARDLSKPPTADK